MRPSDLAPGLLGQVLEAMAPERLRREVDEPLDVALSHYAWPDGTCGTAVELLGHAGELLRFLAKETTWLVRCLGETEAKADAAWLPERYYAGVGARGMGTSLADARDPETGGVATVLAGLAEIIRQEARRRYVQGELGRLLDHLNWDQACMLAENAQALLVPWLPEELRSLDPEQLAKDCVQLVMNYLDVEDGLYRS